MTTSEQLIKWYKSNCRELPWRDTKEPYKIWLSEIILQQTRVNQGLDYYYEFVENFPTIEDLANANLDKVLKLWQGLGYYSRARNLHETAKTIVKEFNGIFPKDYKELIKLKGIGTYTAAAICSFAYNQNYAVVDGNVYRVLSRLYNINTPIDSTIGKKLFNSLAKENLSKVQPDLHNQAIMEFGALVCLPKSPNCSICIFNQTCLSLKENTVNQLPIKAKKSKQTNRYFNYLFFENNNETLISKRLKNDIWKSLYEFPLIETKQKVNNIIELGIKLNNLKLIHVKEMPPHMLSHQKIHAKFWHIHTKKLQKEKNQIKIKISKLKNFPTSKLIENYLNSNS